ncbi:hypothetical protein BDZ90DRAFT_233413 [Jaminaea rosea]|uniref:RNA helicase n=1 Tax=Jaminaea rosea TaxID=1569628 RepID=A0A316UM14_9BASI|nr:hypothetical protein BDZ90DRAFT_233413 [Jaminaea rosea]PWN26280.1 hypothetical protein BDZ90DRAFT_233413 [Jaminaea rosea]
MINAAAIAGYSTRGATSSSSRRILSLTLPQAFHLSTSRLLTTSTHQRRQQQPQRSRSRRQEDGPSRGYSGKGRDPSSSSLTPPPTIWKASNSVIELHARKTRVPDYSLPEPAKDATVASQLEEAIKQLGRDTLISRRIRALGLSHEAAELVLKSVFTNQSKGTDSQGGHIAALLRQWVKNQRYSIEKEQRMLLSPIPSSSKSADKAVLPAPSLPLLTTARNIVDGIPASVVEQDANAVTRALLRSQTVAFLDWVQEQLAKLAADAQPSTEEPSASSPAVIAATSQHTLTLTRSLLDVRNPADLYPEARSIKRSIHLHVGPTNSGKTHGALLRLVRAHTGLYLGPLRLLAHEVWDRINNGKVAPGVSPRPCNLKTGEEEQTMGPLVGLQSSTVEMVDQKQRFDVAVIDEIQMIADPQRGHAWTTALLGVAAKEVHLCGEPSAVPLIKRLVADCGDELTVHEYERLTPLEVAEESLHGDLTKLRPGDCLVGFARSAIFTLKKRIDGIPLPAAPDGSEGGELRCALAYGSLPPELRATQARMFNEGVDANLMVATDAVGMGLNLRIKRVIFETVYKFNGKETIPLSASQIKQIAGRAGRYGMGLNGEADDASSGQALTLQEGDMDVVRAALASPRADLTRASVQPPPENIERLMALLPPDDEVFAREAEERLEREEKEERERQKDEERKQAAQRGGRGRGRSRAGGRMKVVSDALENVESILTEAEGQQEAGQGSWLNSPQTKSSKSHRQAQLRLKAAAFGRVHNVYAELSLFAAIDDSRYFLANFDQAGHSRAVALRASSIATAASSTSANDEDEDESPALVGPSQRRSVLTVSEQNAFALAPIDVRSASVLAAFALFVREYALGNLVLFDSVVERLDLLKSLSVVEALEEKMRREWDNEQSISGQKEAAEAEEPTIRQLMAYVPAWSPINDEVIRGLESLHASLGVYLWLSFRFPLAFSDRTKTAALRKRTERAIELSFEAQRAAREKRLTHLGIRGDGSQLEGQERRGRGGRRAGEGHAPLWGMEEDKPAARRGGYSFGQGREPELRLGSRRDSDGEERRFQGKRGGRGRRQEGYDDTFASSGKGRPSHRWS